MVFRGAIAFEDRGLLLLFVPRGSGFSASFFEHLVRSGNAHRLDESLDLFKTVTGTGELAGTFRAISSRWSPNFLVPPFVPDSVVQALNASYEPRKPDHSFTHSELGLLATLEAWEARRGELDELAAPEQAVCLGKKFNLELATRGFPADKAYDVKKSFAESVDRLRGCGALGSALELTRS